MATANKELLLSRREATNSGFPEDDVEIPGIGTVRVRGLSRFEVFHLQTVNGKGPAAIERLTISMGLVDPQMTEDEIKAWQKVAPIAELQPIVEAISRLSGIGPDAAKQAYKDFEADPGSEFRLLSSGKASDDGSEDAPETEQ